MVQILKEDIRDRIYSAAVEEFYENNYNSAKMKSIAQRANVPTGLIYSYYKNKKTLFAEIVKPIFNKFKIVMNYKEDEEKGEDPYSAFEKKEIDLIMNVFKERKQLIILIDKSEGTEFENAKEELIKLLEIHIREGLANRIKNVEDDYKDFLYHILAGSYMEGMFEIFRHFENFTDAKEMIELHAKQYFYGIYNFIK